MKRPGVNIHSPFQWLVCFHLIVPFYIILDVENMEEDDVILRWEVHGQNKELKIPKRGSLIRKISLHGTAKQTPLEFRAYSNVSKNLIEVNGKEYVRIQAAEDSSPNRIEIQRGKTIH